MANIEFLNKNTDTVECRLIALDADYAQTQRTVYWYFNGKSVGSFTIPNEISESGSITVTNLTSNTFYEVEAAVYSGSTLLSSIYGWVCTTRRASNRYNPYDFSEIRVCQQKDQTYKIYFNSPSDGARAVITNSQCTLYRYRGEYDINNTYYTNDIVIASDGYYYKYNAKYGYRDQITDFAPFENNVMVPSDIRNSYNLSYDDLNIPCVTVSGNVSSERHVYVVYKTTYGINTISGFGYGNQLENFSISPSLLVRYDDTTNKIDIVSTHTGKYLFEFYNKNSASTGDELKKRDAFFSTFMIRLSEGNLKNYWNLAEQKLCRWRKNQTYTVGVEYNGTQSFTNIKNTITTAINALNSVMSSFGITFQMTTETAGDLTIIIGEEDYLWGNKWQLGYNEKNMSWSATVDDTCHITDATIKIFPQLTEYIDVTTQLYPALFKIMGAGTGQTENNVSTCSFEFPNCCTNPYVSGFNTMDTGILQLLYSDDIEAGMSPEEVAIRINSTNGATIVENEQILDFLENGQTYSVKVYAIDENGNISLPVSLTIATPEALRPDEWEWSEIYVDSVTGETGTITATSYIPVDDNGIHPVTASDWNGFLARINVMRRYLGLSDYDFGGNVTQGDKLTPTIYNKAVYAIQEMGSGAGSELNEINEDTVLCTELFTELRDELNAAIRNL